MNILKHFKLRKKDETSKLVAKVAGKYVDHLFVNDNLELLFDNDESNFNQKMKQIKQSKYYSIDLVQGRVFIKVDVDFNIEHILRKRSKYSDDFIVFIKKLTELGVTNMSVLIDNDKFSSSFDISPGELLNINKLSTSSLLILPYLSRNIVTLKVRLSLDELPKLLNISNNFENLRSLSLYFTEQVDHLVLIKHKLLQSFPNLNKFTFGNVDGLPFQVDELIMSNVKHIEIIDLEFKLKTCQLYGINKLTLVNPSSNTTVNSKLEEIVLMSDDSSKVKLIKFKRVPSYLTLTSQEQPNKRKHIYYFQS